MRTHWLIRAVNFTEGWTKKQRKRYKAILTYIMIGLLIGSLVLSVCSFTILKSGSIVIEKEKIVEVVPIEIQNQLTGLEAENTALEQQIAEAQNQVAGLEAIIAALNQQIAGLESEKAALQQQIDELEAENAALQQQIATVMAGYGEAQNQIAGLEAIIVVLNQQIAEYEQVSTPVITLTDVVGTITAQEALDLIEASCPKTSLAGGLRAVEFTTADLVSETVFKSWLAQDKTEDEVLGDSWDYISALEYKLRLQPGGQDVPFNRARVGDQTLAAVVLYDSVDEAARLYIFDPLNEEGMRKIDPANPDQIIEYVHLD